MIREFPADIRYDSEGSGDVVLDVHRYPGVHTFELNGTLLEPSDGYSCSLVPVHDLAHGDPQLVDEYLGKVAQQLAADPVRFESYTGELYVCNRRSDAHVEQATIIAGVNLVGFIALQLALQENGLPGFNVSFPHVTVLRYATDRDDIRVRSIADLVEYCQPCSGLFRAIFGTAADQIT